jgi:hypothetical protein
VVTVDGTWCVMSRVLSGTVVAPIDVIDAFRRELSGLLDDEAVPTSERPDVIWHRIADPLGLRYDHVRGTEP